MGDPEATEAQLEAVASEAAEQVAGANARATRAEQTRRRAEADAAAEEAARKSEDLTGDLVGAQTALTAAHERGKQFVAELARDRAAAAAEKEQAQADAAGLRACGPTWTPHAASCERSSRNVTPWPDRPRPKGGPVPRRRRHAQPGPRTRSRTRPGSCGASSRVPGRTWSAAVRRWPSCAAPWQR